MKKILVSLFFVTCSLFGVTLAEYSRLIENEKIPWIKQVLICERDTELNPKYADANVCLKAADMVLALKGKKLSDHEKIVVRDGIEKSTGIYFFHAGVIYGAQGDKKNEVIMYEKAIEYKVKNAFYNLGISYYYGEGVAKNHIKAYEHFKEALKLGYADAQNSIEIVCKESPWACK